MVKNLSIVCISISLLVIFLVPIGLIVYMYRKHRISFKAVLVGAVVFVVFQNLLRIPILNALSTQMWFKVLQMNAWGHSLFLGITAGLFEEIGRFIGFKYFLKDRLEWKNGIAYGVGHGGIEAIIFMGLVYINNLVYSIYINSGKFDSIIGSRLPQNIVLPIKSALINSSPFIFLYGGIDRLIVITIQIALSLVVLYAVLYKKYSYLVIAIVLHTLVDFPSGVMSAMGVNMWIVESYLLICAVISIIFIIRSKKRLEKV